MIIGALIVVVWRTVGGVIVGIVDDVVVVGVVVTSSTMRADATVTVDSGYSCYFCSLS